MSNTLTNTKRTFVYTPEVISNYARVVIAAETESLQRAILAYKQYRAASFPGESARVQTNDPGRIHNSVCIEH